MPQGQRAVLLNTYYRARELLICEIHIHDEESDNR